MAYSTAASGWGDPSNIVQSGGYYYFAAFNRNQVGLQAPGICFFRTAELIDPSSWRAWGGESYSVPLVSPYTLPPGTEKDHLCVVANLPVCAPAGLAWSPTLSLFIVTLACDEQSGHSFSYATSSDLITWSALSPLYSFSQLPKNASAMVTSMSYPTFIDPSAPYAFNDPNYGTIGSDPYLFWVSIGHSPYTDGRRLWATPFSVKP